MRLAHRLFTVTNSMTVRTQQDEIVVSIVCTIAVLVVYLKNWYARIHVSTILANLFAHSSYTHFIEKITSLGFIRAFTALFSANGVQPLQSANRGTKSTYSRLLSGRENRSAYLARSCRIRFARQAACTLSRAKTIICMVLDKVATTMLALAVVGFRPLVKNEISVPSAPMALQPEFSVTYWNLTAALTKSGHRTELYFSRVLMSSI